MSHSKGDPRVLFVMNLVLSGVFATFIVWGLAFLEVTTFTLRNVAFGTLLLMLVTYVLTQR